MEVTVLLLAILGHLGLPPFLCAEVIEQREEAELSPPWEKDANYVPSFSLAYLCQGCPLFVFRHRDYPSPRRQERKCAALKQAAR